jgi:hypothetical protein
MKTKTVEAPPEAEACRQAMMDAMRPFADALGGPGMLAVASALVGQSMALPPDAPRPRFPRKDTTQ